MKAFSTLLYIFFFSAGLLQAQQPNILFIAVDDLKPAMGSYGDTVAVTPHIDALAGKGMMFSNAHCQQAICAPSRVSLMTSRYPDQTRVWDLQTQMRDMDPGIVSLPQYLITKGYNTMGTGKIFDPRSVDSGKDAPSWSLPFRNAWDKKYYHEQIKPVGYYYASQEARDSFEVLQAEANKLGENATSYFLQRYKPSREKADVHIDAYGDGAIKNVGVELMEEAAASGKPFFLAVGFNRPHLPFCAPEEFFDLYDREKIPLAPFRERAQASPSQAYHTWGELRGYTDIPSSGELEDSVQRDLIHAYYAATSYIDHLVGLTVAHLDELGLSENTIIILWGDHGWHLGDHGLWCKHSNFEQATRVPLIIYDPRHGHEQHISNSPVEFTDVAPTLLDLAGIQIPGYFEGQSMLPILNDPTAKVRQGALSQYPRNGEMGYTLRDERYRYTRWETSSGQLSASELYDYHSDPLETVNLAGVQDYADLVSVLDSLVRERIAIPSTQHRLYLRIMEEDSQGNRSEVKGSAVSLAGEVRESAEDGSVFFTHIAGEHSIGVKHEDFMDLDTQISLDGDMHMELLVQRKTPAYSMEFQVVDQYTRKKLKNVSIILEEVQGSGQEILRVQTNSNGEAQMEADQGSYTLRFEKSNYHPASEELSLNENASLLKSLKASHANLKFRLNEDGIPLNNAEVKLDTARQLSNSLGMVSYEWMPTDISYSWMVTREGYELQQGQLELVADTTIELDMQKLTSLRERNTSGNLSIWPNPAGEYLNFELANGQELRSVELLTSTGQVVHRMDGPAFQGCIDLRSLAPGWYILRAWDGKQFYHSAMIKSSDK